MLSQAGEDAHSSRLTADNMASALPSGPVLSSLKHRWNRVNLQRFQFGTHILDMPAMSDHVLSLQLGGPVLIDVQKEIGGRERRWFEVGQMNLIPAGQECKHSLSGRSDVLIVHLQPDLVGELYHEIYDRDPSNLVLIPRLAYPDESVNRLCSLLMAEAESGSSDAALMAETLGRALSVHLLRHHSNVSTPRPESKCSIPSGRLRKVTDYMRTHMDENLCGAELAQLIGLSQSQFARAFRAATGLPPHRYLLGLRIERAKHLLERTEAAIIDIASKCGFEQPSHFATMFRQHVGMSPRCWRASRRSC